MTENGGWVSVKREEIALDPGPRSGVYTDLVKMKRNPLRPLRSGQLARLGQVEPRYSTALRAKGPAVVSATVCQRVSRCPPEAVARVSLIRSALSIGFTLDELARILKIRDAGGVPCHKVRDLAASKLRALDTHIRQLRELRDQLRTVLTSWEQALGQGQPHRRAGRLESLVAAQRMNSKPLPPYLYAALSKETSR